MEKIGYLEIRISGTIGNLELKPHKNKENSHLFTKEYETIEYNPKYDADYLKQLRHKAMGWLSQVDPDEWLRDIRGGYSL